MSYHILLPQIIPYHIIWYHIIPDRILSYHIITYHIISYHIKSYHIKSSRVISNHIISDHIISYQILSYQINQLYASCFLSRYFQKNKEGETVKLGSISCPLHGSRPKCNLLLCVCFSVDWLVEGQILFFFLVFKTPKLRKFKTWSMTTTDSWRNVSLTNRFVMCKRTPARSSKQRVATRAAIANVKLPMLELRTLALLLRPIQWSSDKQQTDNRQSKVAKLQYQ